MKWWKNKHSMLPDISFSLHAVEAEFSLAAISTVCLQVCIQSLLGHALSIFLGCYIISLPRVQKRWSFIPTVYHLTVTAQHPSHDQLAIWFCSRFWDTEGWWAPAGMDFGNKHRMKRSNKKIGRGRRRGGWTLDTSCCWHDTKVWKPGATPNPSWSMKGGSSWLWIWTLIPAS